MPDLVDGVLELETVGEVGPDEGLLGVGEGGPALRDQTVGVDHPHVLVRHLHGATQSHSSVTGGIEVERRVEGMYLARQALFDHAVDQAVDDAQSGAAAAEAHDALLGDLLGRLALRPERRQNTGQRDRAGALHDVTPTLFIGQFQKRGLVSCRVVCVLPECRR